MTTPIDPNIMARLAAAGYPSSASPQTIAEPQPQPEMAPPAMQPQTMVAQAQPQAMLQEQTQQPMQIIDQKQVAADFQKQKLMKQAETMKALGVSDADIDNKIGGQIRDIDKKLVLTTDVDDMGRPLTPPSEQPRVAPKDMMGTTALTAGYDLMQQGVGLAAQAGMAKAAEDAAYSQKISADMQKMNEANERERLANQEKLMAEQAKLDAEVQRVSELKVDPGRFWADRSTADKVLIGASLFLGAFGAARTGVNQAVNIIDQAIERDLNLQQADIAQQTSGVEKKRGILEQMRATYKDDFLARSAAKVAYLQDAENKIRGIAARYEGQEAQGKAMQLIGQIELQKQAANALFMQKYQSMQPVTADTNPTMLTEDQRERFVPGYGLALTKDSATKARDLVGTFDSIKTNINELKNILETPAKSISPDLRARAGTISSILKGQLRTPLIGPGAVSESEWKLLDEIIANPTKITALDSVTKSRLNTLYERMDIQTANQLKTMGLISPQTRAKQELGFTPLK